MIRGCGCADLPGGCSDTRRRRQVHCGCTTSPKAMSAHVNAGSGPGCPSGRRAGLRDCNQLCHERLGRHCVGSYPPIPTPRDAPTGVVPPFLTASPSFSGFIPGNLPLVRTHRAITQVSGGFSPPGTSIIPVKFHAVQSIGTLAHSFSERIAEQWVLPRTRRLPDD